MVRPDKAVDDHVNNSKRATDRKRPLFTVPAGLVRILDRDLLAAGIDKRDEQGRTVDAHALRTAQAAMGHSTTDLTMNVYTEPKPLDVPGALDTLPSLDVNSSPTQCPSMRATGTLRPLQDIPPTPLHRCFTNSGERGQTVLFAVHSSTGTRDSQRGRANDGNPRVSKQKSLIHSVCE